MALRDLGAHDDARPFADPVSVDLNRAPLAELTTLRGLGTARAAEIVLHRVRHGPFHRLEDVAAVDGIGPSTVEALRPFVVLR